MITNGGEEHKKGWPLTMRKEDGHDDDKERNHCPCSSCETSFRDTGRDHSPAFLTSDGADGEDGSRDESCRREKNQVPGHWQKRGDNDPKSTTDEPKSVQPDG